jgi:hypothetical protein
MTSKACTSILLSSRVARLPMNLATRAYTKLSFTTFASSCQVRTRTEGGNRTHTEHVCACGEGGHPARVLEGRKGTPCTAEMLAFVGLRHEPRVCTHWEMPRIPLLDAHGKRVQVLVQLQTKHHADASEQARPGPASRATNHKHARSAKPKPSQTSQTSHCTWSSKLML